MASVSAQANINLKQPSYRRLRAVLAERTRPVVLWCGAGLSMPVGLPDWKGLKVKLLDDLEQKAISFLEPDPQRSRLLGRAQAIEEEANVWLAFTMLQSELGPASFKEGIREHLALPHAAEVPSQYVGFWDVGIRGVVNLNLDRLATRAYAEVRRKVLLEVNSSNIEAAPNIVGSGKDFVLNLHGILEDVNSWIVTHEELKKLQNREAYKTTASAIFTNFAVLFAGISADDVGAGGFLESLTRVNIDLGGHFWMTSRRDPGTDHWAEDAGLQIIRYSSEDGHEPAFAAMFTDLATFTPQEEIPPAVRTDLVSPQNKIGEPAELASQTPEEIRHQIASYARHILEQSDKPIPEEYRAFTSRYARPIYNAWYVSSEPPENSFFGYEIGKALGEGAFANVYEATAPDGSGCAIKVMRQNLANNDAMISCFRRGINSMRILESHKVEGMVRLLDAVELPAAIFMEHVNGPTLETVVESHSLEPWHDGLKILRKVAAIIREGHRLPERVLHRDLRPSNIMLRNFYEPDVDTEVVVLDFDLSWHRGAYDVTLTQHAQAALGYLAPEQVLRDINISTRSAAVDTYGLCATIYFVFSGEHPYQGLFRSDDFEQRFRRKCASAKETLAYSVGNRLRRLVTSGVAWRQENRPDFGEIEHELQLMEGAVSDINTIDSPDFWAEELLCRARGKDDYRYDADGQQYVSQLPSGLNIRLAPDFAAKSVRLNVEYAAGGNVDRKNVVKFIKVRVPEVISLLEQSGFDIQKGSTQQWSESYSMRAAIKMHVLQNSLDSLTKTLKRAVDRLTVN